MDLCRLYEGLYPLDLYVLGRNAQTAFTALSAQVLPRPGGFPPLYSVGFGIPRIKRRGYDGCSSNSIYYSCYSSSSLIANKFYNLVRRPLSFVAPSYFAAWLYPTFRPI